MSSLAVPELLVQHHAAAISPRAGAAAHLQRSCLMRAATSPVLDSLHRPVNPESRVESEERIRCVMMNALEEALATARDSGHAPVSASLPIVIRMPKPRPNPFLTPRLDTDPPPPWVGSAASRSRRRVRRGLRGLAVLALAIAAAIVLYVSPRARSAAIHAGVHVTKMLARP